MQLPSARKFFFLHKKCTISYKLFPNHNLAVQQANFVVHIWDKHVWLLTLQAENEVAGRRKVPMGEPILHKQKDILANCLCMIKWSLPRKALWMRLHWGGDSFSISKPHKYRRGSISHLLDFPAFITAGIPRQWTRSRYCNIETLMHYPLSTRMLVKALLQAAYSFYLEELFPLTYINGLKEKLPELLKILGQEKHAIIKEISLFKDKPSMKSKWPKKS